MDFKYSYGLDVYDLNIVAIKNIIITWLQMKDGQCFIFLLYQPFTMFWIGYRHVS